MESLEKLLTSGGDERIQLKENGLNKNFINPATHEGTLFRGSCTCSTLNNESYPRVTEVLNQLQTDDFADHVERQRQTIKQLAGEEYKDSFEVFFAPSGTGLNYYGLLFASILNPNKPIHNIITCSDELGSGTPNAAAGKFFSELNQFGEPVEKGTPLSEDLRVHLHQFPARDDEGSIVSRKAEVLEKLANLSDEPSVIANLVIGSKSGIEESATIIPRSPENTLWLIDMCQLRAPSELINRLISLGAMIMITGSKFYQAPPYCGALLVPKTFLDKLPQDREPSVYEPFLKTFSKNDIPPSLPWLRKHFRDFNNTGLLLRWESAIFEMEQISKQSVDVVMDIMSEWYRTVVQEIKANRPLFELMPDGEITNKTIISFRLKHKNGEYFTEPELRAIYKAISLGEHEGLGPGKKLIIGQPVKFRGEAFIRLALGSFSVRNMIRKGVKPEREKRVIQIIRQTAEAFEAGEIS